MFETTNQIETPRFRHRNHHRKLPTPVIQRQNSAPASPRSVPTNPGDSQHRCALKRKPVARWLNPHDLPMKNADLEICSMNFHDLGMGQNLLP